jgi:serine phosphatase RsbU (regulator of sigma subunit)
MMIVDQEDGAVRRFNAQIPPLGITSLYNLAVEPTRHDLRASFLCLATDGVTEARAAGRELGLNGLAGLLGRIKAKGAEERVDAVMRLFEAGKLTTHDDATLLIVTAAGLASS